MCMIVVHIPIVYVVYRMEYDVWFTHYMYGAGMSVFCSLSYIELSTLNFFPPHHSGIDISFPQAEVLYGLPEHTSPLALPTTLPSHDNQQPRKYLYS